MKDSSDKMIVCYACCIIKHCTIDPTERERRGGGGGSVLVQNIGIVHYDTTSYLCVIHRGPRKPPHGLFLQTLQEIFDITVIHKTIDDILTAWHEDAFYIELVKFPRNSCL